MGFDLYGIKPTNKRGEYFRNNVWYWRPLANYVLQHCTIPAEEQEDWHSNSGQKVSEKTAVQIGLQLMKLYRSGHTKLYAQKYRTKIRNMPLIPCPYCAATGQRNDDIVKGTCNGCNGTGKTKAWDTHYPFSVTNVRDFAKFCLESGGFEIC